MIRQKWEQDRVQRCVENGIGMAELHRRRDKPHQRQDWELIQVSVPFPNKGFFRVSIAELPKGITDVLYKDEHSFILQIRRDRDGAVIGWDYWHDITGVYEMFSPTGFMFNKGKR